MMILLIFFLDATEDHLSFIIFPLNNQINFSTYHNPKHPQNSMYIEIQRARKKYTTSVFYGAHLGHGCFLI